MPYSLFTEEFTEDRVDVILIADMLHGEIVERIAQRFIFAPERLV